MIRRAIPIAAATLAIAGALAACQSSSSPSAPGSGSASLPGAIQTLAAQSKTTPNPAYDKWSWFKDTYWYVPENGIYSVAHSPSDPSNFQVVRGQTLFHITDYFNGYWTGSVVVKLTEALMPSCQFVLGQVSPQGNVYMTMFNAESGEITNEPTGEMVKENNEWTMVNEMTGPTQKGTVSHWAYMIQTKPGDAIFNNLPFANQSVTDFMSGCPAGPMIT